MKKSSRSPAPLWGAVTRTNDCTSPFAYKGQGLLLLAIATSVLAYTYFHCCRKTWNRCSGR